MKDLRWQYCGLKAAALDLGNRTHCLANLLGDFGNKEARVGGLVGQLSGDNDDGGHRGGSPLHYLCIISGEKRRKSRCEDLGDSW